jgi:hypothetical protein
MHHQKSVNSLSDLRRLPISLRPDVEVTRAGGFYRARWRGSANCVFGTSPQEAEARLRTASPATYQNSQRNAEEREFKTTLREPQ